MLDHKKEEHHTHHTPEPHAAHAQKQEVPAPAAEATPPQPAPLTPFQRAAGELGRLLEILNNAIPLYQNAQTAYTNSQPDQALQNMQLADAALAKAINASTSTKAEAAKPQ